MHRLIFLLIVFLPACSNVKQISNSGFGAFEADIAVLDANTVAVAWYDTRHPKAEIYLRLLDRHLGFTSPEFRLSANNANCYEVDIALLGNNIAATWYEIDDAEHSVVKLGLWDRQGKRLWIRTLTNSNVNARIPVLETKTEALFIAWLESPADSAPQINATTLAGMWVGANGENRSEAFTIAQASRTTWNLNIALDNSENSNRILLAYDSEHETRANELYLAQILGTEILINRLSNDDGYASKYPDIALNKNQLALTWFDNRFANNEIYTAVRSTNEWLASDITDKLASGAVRITHTDGDSIGAYIVWNGATLGLAWSDSDMNSEKSHYDVYFQALDARGRPQSTAQALSRSRADSLIPSIHKFGSGFVLGWNEVTLQAHSADARQTRSEIAVTLAQ